MSCSPVLSCRLFYVKRCALTLQRVTAMPSAASQWLADRGVPVMFAYRPLLLPKPVEWGPSCHVIGPWLPPLAAAPREGKVHPPSCRSKLMVCAARLTDRATVSRSMKWHVVF